MGIGEFGMRNSSSSLAILYPVFSSLLQLRCSAFLPTIRLQFQQNTKAFFRKGIKLFVSEKVSKEPWYKNTLFVFTADHTNSPERPEYETESGLFSVPVVFYQPGSNLKGFRKDVIAQQIDIMPTVLGYLGYDKPFVSFGCDLLNTPAEDTYAVNYINGIYQFFKGDYLLQFDGRNAVAMYAFKTDKLLEHNLLGQIDVQQSMEDELKAIIQQYMIRMNNDELVVK